MEVADVSVVVGEIRGEHRVERNGQTKKTGCVDKADDASDRMKRCSGQSTCRVCIETGVVVE